MAVRRRGAAKNPGFLFPLKDPSFQLGKKWKEMHVGTCFSQQFPKCGKTSS